MRLWRRSGCLSERMERQSIFVRSEGRVAETKERVEGATRRADRGRWPAVAKRTTAAWACGVAETNAKTHRYQDNSAEHPLAKLGASGQAPSGAQHWSGAQGGPCNQLVLGVKPRVFPSTSPGTW